MRLILMYAMLALFAVGLLFFNKNEERLAVDTGTVAWDPPAQKAQELPVLAKLSLSSLRR